MVQPADFRFEPKQLWFGLRVHCQTWDLWGKLTGEGYGGYAFNSAHDSTYGQFHGTIQGLNSNLVAGKLSLVIISVEHRTQVMTFYRRQQWPVGKSQQ